ncbi:hypothetical protein ASH01_16280 [Terrabacter sp. Soil811]|uniref:phosphotransferase n=1 Tax=Terrabacter sp. Soil811 TaxID=1736419 RepID=UPI0006F607F5|nr:phosphotransferase [Terrabacter sp. Soil811]KRF42397.1 hypothetical protein ASH01_16280 [Terrabacter sp. Soil811]
MTPPADFSTDLLAAALREMWVLEVREITYVPVGFGSHHWRVDAHEDGRWFVTLDDYSGARADVERGAALSSAFRTARALADSGLDFVVAPVPARDGAVPFELGRHRWVSMTPWLDAPRLPSPSEQTTADRHAVTDVLARLHAATPRAVGVAGTDDLTLPGRAPLDRALAADLPPGAGPYGARARDALAEHAEAVRRALVVWDERAVRDHAERDSWVITHGEPHWRNVLSDADGLHVVDWDTALLAPAARDLWHVAGAEGVLADAVLADYAALTGRTVTTDDLRAQALRWDLTEVALYAAWFGRPHADDADGEIAWGGFTESLSSVGARASAG